MGKTIIKGAWLMTPEGLKKDTGLIMEGGLITQIGPNASFNAGEADEVLDCTDQIILPGFVNGHNHMYGFLSHGITAEAIVTEFSSFLDDFWWPYVEDRLDHELVEATTEMACVEMIDSGVTSFVDILEGPHSIPGALEVEAKVVEKAGLRGKLSFEACERAGDEIAELGLKENYDFLTSRGKDDLVQGLMCIHTLFTCKGEYVKKAKALANEAGALIHMHLSESIFEPTWCHEHLGKGPVEYYDELGYLDENVLASQVVQVTDEEIDLLAKRGVKAVSMPISNCEVGGGFAPISKMLAKGMTVGLGTDGYVNNFFEVMRGAFLMHKANEQSTQTMPADLVYKMATSLGADACGFEGCGRLVEGAKADVITLDLDIPTPINEHNVYDQVVLFENPEHVVNVFVDGRALKRDYKLTTMDKAAVKARMREVADGFWHV